MRNNRSILSEVCRRKPKYSGQAGKHVKEGRMKAEDESWEEISGRNNMRLFHRLDRSMFDS